jgi:hypothetical protein
MSFVDWEFFLRRWSQAILESMNDEQLAQLPQSVIESGWLGYPGATEEQIAQAEARLRVRFPPSYRDFLKVTNGWRQTTPFIRRLWSTEDIERFVTRHQKWIEAFTERHENAPFGYEQTSELNDLWETSTISDEEYCIYGEDQDCSKLRIEYLQTAIEISDVGASAIYLLNPQIVTEGEWEAWFFCDMLPGADRYRSFRDMMAAEYQNFLELRETTLEPNEPLHSVESQDISKPLESNLLGDTHQSFKPMVAFADVASEQIDPGAAIATKPEPWTLLKRLTIEFQRRQMGDRTQYRTVASNATSNQLRTWTGLGEHKLRLWIRQQLTDEILNNPPTTPNSSKPAAKISTAPPALKLEIDQLKVWQPSHPATQIMLYQAKHTQPKQILPDSLTSQKPFSLEVAFKLVGQTITQFSMQPTITYKAHFYAHNRTTGKCVSLGETEPSALVSGASIHTAKLAETSLEPGLYRLQVLTTLQGVPVTPAYFEMPLVQVV